MSDATRNDTLPFIVPLSEGGLVTTDNMSSLELLLPPIDDEEEMPDIMLFLVAVMLRAQNDDGFVQEQLDWMEEQQQELNS